jgi:hypothetical protein
MGKSITVAPNEKGEYFLDVEVAGERKKAQLDPGYTGTGGGGACTVTEENFKKIKDKLKNKGKGGEATDYKGDKITPEYGKGKIKIVGLDTEVEKFITFSGSKTDLLGTTLVHNLMDEAGLEILWKGKKMTFTVPEKKKDKEEEKKKIEEKLKSFDEQLEKNKVFYEREKRRITERYAGRYVVIADGEIKDVCDSYDDAIERSAPFEETFFNVLVFKAGEEPFFGTEAHGLGASTGPDERADAV